MTTIRLTAAQALVRWLSVQRAEDGSRFIEGVWAIFGHGNVAAMGEAGLFVKMVGPKALVEANTAGFDQFVSSLRLRMPQGQ